MILLTVYRALYKPEHASKFMYLVVSRDHVLLNIVKHDNILTFFTGTCEDVW